MSNSTVNSQISILDRAFATSASAMTRDVARYLLAIELDPHDAQRANELAQRAREGSLTAQESLEVDEYRRVGRVIEMLKLRAQVALHAPE